MVALRFWDKCQLSPLHGPKEILWLSVFPTNNMKFSVDIDHYMSIISSYWDSFSLGCISPCPILEHKGHLPIQNESDTYEALISAYMSNIPLLGIP